MNAVLLLAALTLSADGRDQVPLVPGLPNVLIIGDSVSIGYTWPARGDLDGIANVQHIPVNGLSTANALRPTAGIPLVNTWLAGQFWDVVYWNFGIHDMRRDVNPPNRWVEPGPYETNLHTLAGIIRATGSEQVFATTTPLVTGSSSVHAGDELEYNDIAHKVMDFEGVPISDLYGVVAPEIWLYQIGNGDLHFTQYGYETLGHQVAADIIKALPVPGDADGDGSVGLSDFGVLKSHFGTGTNRLQGDLNWDGQVDLSDFGVLKAGFGHSKAVPEPSGWLLAVIGLLAGLAAVQRPRGEA